MNPETNHSRDRATRNLNTASMFTPIAICGMACRLPGRIHTPQELWDFLMSKGDARTLVPETRYNISGYYSNSKKPGTTVSQYGYFLDSTVDLGALDTSFFPMARKEAERLDPQQRILLEVARESLDDAGEVGWKGESVGVYVGNFGNDWYDMAQADTQNDRIYDVSTTHDFTLSNRVSYEMDLRGPSMTIRTACSSSLIALSEACASIARGECTSAIVGGTNILMAPSLTIAISERGALSPDGSCKTFSSAANGYARGEGVVTLYIKPLYDALRDGNPVRAVVIGAATNCDGKTPGFSVPSPTAQEELVRHTYRLAGIAREELPKTAYFECHGTATPVGDPIEATAVARIFGDSGGIHIGSIKPNLGHGEGVSGLIALLKAVLALEHQIIPPTIKCLPLNPKIPFESGRLTVPTEATPWPKERYERVSVNSFGIGGANAHVIVDSASRFGIPKQTTTKNTETNMPQLFLYSAKSTQSLKRMTENWRSFLENAPENLSLADISYTLANRREHLPFRSFAVGTRYKPGIASSPTSPANPPSVVMVFTGQGSQWPQMGRELLQDNPVFRCTIRLLDDYLQTLGSNAPDWKIEGELLRPSQTSRANKAEFSQPLCTALQIALVDTLTSVGIKPRAVVGHSSGEIAAAYAAGGLTAKEAITVAFLRGLISEKQTKPGAMAAVGLSWQDTKKYLLPGVVVACENSPSSVTLSGDVDQLKSVVAAIKKAVPGVLASTLKVDKAYHSHHMLELGESYYQAMVDAGVVGSKVPESSGIEPVWRNVLRLDNVPWVRDHKIRDDIIFPFAGYIAMAAEAVGQITGIKDFVELQHVTVTTSLVLNEGSPAELVTNCRRCRLTDALDSQWWEFTITSYNGLSWTKHCVGKVRATSQTTCGNGNIPKNRSLPNTVNMPRWYERVRRAGLNYGHHFRTVESMNTSASGTRGMANGKLRNNWHGDEANYHIHPAVLDTCFQLLAAAANHGITHAYKQFIPLSLEYMAVSRCSADCLEIGTTCEPSGDGVLGDGECITDLRAFVKFSGAHMTPFDKGDDKINRDDVPITARSEWVPHIDFMNVSALVKPVRDHTVYMPKLELLAQSAVVLSRRSLSTTNTTAYSPHMQRYGQWLDQQIFPSLDRMDTTTLTDSMDSLAASLAGTPAGQAAIAISNVCANIVPIATGKKTGLETLSTDETLLKLNRFMSDYDASSFFRCLAQSKPILCVLELGTGLGPAAHGIWNYMGRPDGYVLYSKYVYAEALPALTNAAKERFGSVIPNLEFATLDISKDPEDQGFQDHVFDLVVANGVLHTTDRFRTSLGYVNKLLRPGGRLLMQQPRVGLIWTKYVLGVLSGWWCGVDDGRPDEPYVCPSGWADGLAAAGFEDSAGVVLDSPEPFHLSTIMVAKSRRTRSPSKRVAILHGDGGSHESEPLVRRLEAEGFRVSRCTLNEALPEAQHDVISLLDRKSPFFEGISSTTFDNFKTLLKRLDSSGSGMFWVTMPSQTHCPDPRYATVVGVARTIRSEMGIDFATCETDNVDSSTLDLESVANVFRRFHEREADGGLDPDFEYAISKGVTRVNRFFPFNLEEDGNASETLAEAILNIGRPGRLDTLYWASHQTRIPTENEIEVEIHAAGLNFRDVLTATGAIEFRSRNPALGCEAAGIVRRVGTDTSKFCVGDRVVLMGVQTFSTLITLSELLCEKLPDEISFADGASMPVAFMTAIQSLINVARLEKGQSVLIHSGGGGVGLASIQIAHMIGAQVYTTVSNQEKAAYLVEKFNINERHIFNSRSVSFVDDLMRETKGQGVDVALNSLSGELLHETWRCVAKFGTMVEIGKKDLFGAGKLDMDKFLANRSYCCVDLYQLGLERPWAVNRMLDLMMSYYRQGFIQPLPLARVFPASATADAIRCMQQGTHIGKIAISLRDSSTERLEVGRIIPVRRDSNLYDPDASYLLVGGLGGLGRSISIWMVQRGARNLSFLSRRAGSGTDERDFVHTLESMGCAVQLVRGSVTDLTAVRSAIDGVPVPLKGIIQMSMVLRDKGFSHMTIDDWNETTGPKIQGTWNLHHVSRERGVELDFFLLMSSLSGIIGQVGQANYAAANSFLDAFVKYRSAIGLPCTAIDVGAMEGVGYLSENRDLLKKMKGTGWRSVTEEQLLEAVGAATKRSLTTEGERSQTLGSSLSFPSWAGTISDQHNMLLGISPAIPLSSPDSSPRLRKDVRMAVYHNMGQSRSGRPNGSDGGDDNSLRSFLSLAKMNPAVLKQPETAAMLAREIGKKLFALLLRPEQEPDISLGLAEVGLDSMIAVELREWWKLEFGLTISVLEMLAMGTLGALGERAAKELVSMFDG
ncbi:hypothetical protein DL769_004844 [Monosporascus sp. CRB-8-3]|nr:hypothetical protein DL769_004844 [Monosporascus sp. CRB-8-3]